MSPYLLKSLTPVQYLVSQLHSLPSLRFSHALQAGMRYFYIPSEMSCAHTICFDTNTSVSLCYFFHTVTPLHSHNMDTLLLPCPFLSPSPFLFILPPPLPFFNTIVTLPRDIMNHYILTLLNCHITAHYRTAGSCLKSWMDCTFCYRLTASVPRIPVKKLLRKS